MALPAGLTPAQIQDELNRLSPATSRVKLGDLLVALIAAHNGVTAKLDADAGVTDTNYTALFAAPAFGSL